jgi:methionyl-tRNA formyltransferase
VIPWTILQGTDSTGSSLFWLSEGADEGDLIGQELFSVAENETARTLMDKHLAALEKLLLSLTEYEQVGQFPRVPQDSCQATLCFRRTPEDGRINWLESANAIERLVRATGEPYPGAFAYNGNKMLRIWDANVVDRSHYWAVSGQIVEVDRGGPILRCASNTHLQLTRLSYDDGGDFEARVGARLA